MGGGDGMRGPKHRAEKEVTPPTEAEGGVTQTSFRKTVGMQSARQSGTVGHEYRTPPAPSGPQRTKKLDAAAVAFPPRAGVMQTVEAADVTVWFPVQLPAEYRATDARWEPWAATVPARPARRAARSMVSA
jgi:hypothetical protein